MGKVFPLPSRAPAAPLPSAQPVRRDLWSVTTGCNMLGAKPRDATGAEMRAYLLDLAQWRGIDVPGNATISEAGIYVEGSGYIVPMPGYGADTAVIMEVTDETGAVRTSRIGVDRKGYIGLKAEAVREACALPKVAKPRKAAKRAVEAPEPASVTVEPAPAEIAPVAVVAPVPAPSGDVEALAARVAALEAAIARLSRPASRQRTERHARAIQRAWDMRRAMRERADLDRRALLIANGDNRLLLESLHRAEAERNEAREQAANARTAATDYKREGDLMARDFMAANRRGSRMVRAAMRQRAAVRRLRDDLRGSQAEARALARRLTDAPRARPSLASAITTVDSGAVAALAA